MGRRVVAQGVPPVVTTSRILRFAGFAGKARHLNCQVVDVRGVRDLDAGVAIDVELERNGRPALHSVQGTGHGIDRLVEADARERARRESERRERRRQPADRTRRRIHARGDIHPARQGHVIVEQPRKAGERDAGIAEADLDRSVECQARRLA